MSKKYKLCQPNFNNIIFSLKYDQKFFLNTNVITLQFQIIIKDSREGENEVFIYGIH